MPVLAGRVLSIAERPRKVVKERETDMCKVQRRPASLDKDFCKKTAWVKNLRLQDSQSNWSNSMRCRVMSWIAGDRKHELFKRTTADLKQVSVFWMLRRQLSLSHPMPGNLSSPENLC